MKIRDIIESWWPLLAISIVIITVIWASYTMSSGNSTQPIDGVSAGGSLLFSSYLLYIYYRQNDILENQQKIMENEMEIQAASHVEPRFNIDWEVEGEKIILRIENIGEGDAFQTSLHTDLEITDGPDMDIDFTDNLEELSEYIAEGESIEVSVPLMFRTITQDESRNIPFLEVSHSIWRQTGATLRGRDAESTKVEISISIKYFDSRSEPDYTNFVNETVEISGPSQLTCTQSGDIAITEIDPPDVHIADWGVLNTDAIGLTLQNTGDMSAEDLKIYSEIRVKYDDEWVSASSLSVSQHRIPFEFGGQELTPSPPATSISTEKELTCSLLFTADGQSVDFESLSEKLLNLDFTSQMNVTVRIEYNDGMGVDYGHRIAGVRSFTLTGDPDYSPMSGEKVVSAPQKLSDI